MEEYKLFCIVLLFTLIIGSQSSPHKTSEGTGTHQSRGRTRKAATTDDIDAVGDGEDITFPDEFKADGKGFKCKNDICLEANDYPLDHINTIVSQLPKLYEGLAGNVVNSESRINSPDPDWEAFCKTTVYTEYPKTMKTERDIAKFIVNVEDYKQGVIWETCATEEFPGVASLPIEYQAKCSQKYTTVRLLAIEPDEKGAATHDTFPVPSSCVGVYTKKKKNN